MKDLNSVFAIVSAQRYNATELQNSINHEQLGYLLTMNGYTVTEVDGVFNDLKEKSYLVTGGPNDNGWPMFSIVSSMAQTYCQDSFVLGDGTGAAYLFSTNSKKAMFKFDSVRESVPSDKSYTIMPDGYRFTLC
jgi:hypothetical protein